MLNTICLDCKKLNNGCSGTENQNWTGCIYKEKTERREDSPRWCIFEKRICGYANKNGNVFTCDAPSDDEMTCR